MKVGPIAHGVLLVAALGLAYKSWTREVPKETKVGTHVVWNEDPASFTGLSFDSENKSVRLERKGKGKDAYLWATVTRTNKTPTPKATPAAPEGTPAAPGKPGTPVKPATPAKPTTPPAEAAKPATPTKPTDAPAKPTDAPAKPPTATPPVEAAKPGPAKASDEDPHGHGAPPEGGTDEAAAAPGADATDATDPVGPGEPAPVPETVRTEKQFPVGAEGDTLVTNLSQLRALRVLGVLSEDKKTEYGLTEGTESLSVSFGSTSHELVVGARVFGGSDRYVLDPTSGKAYVISTEIMKPLDGAESGLMLKKLHAYEDDAVEKLEIDTSFGKKALVKKVVEDEGKKQTGWALADKPDAPDQTLTNFISQVEKLKPTEYAPTLEVASLEKVLTVSYAGKAGALGNLVLYRRPPQPPEPGAKGEPKPEYYVQTELTRVPGKVSFGAAERLENNDVPQLFGKPGKPEPEKPASDGPPAGIARPDKVDGSPTKAPGKVVMPQPMMAPPPKRP
jgi:hypothetical protein